MMHFRVGWVVQEKGRFYGASFMRNDMCGCKCYLQRIIRVSHNFTTLTIVDGLNDALNDDDLMIWNLISFWVKLSIFPLHNYYVTGWLARMFMFDSLHVMIGTTEDCVTNGILRRVTIKVIHVNDQISKTINIIITQFTYNPHLGSFQIPSLGRKFIMASWQTRRRERKKARRVIKSDFNILLTFY